MKQAAGRGTSRYSIGIKSWPEVIVNWILMKIVFFGHLISHLWRKMAIVWAIFGMIFRLFTGSDAFMLKKGAHSTWIYLTHVRSRIQAILGPLSHKSMAGRRQKWPICDQKWPNMAGLPMSRCGPKGSQMGHFWCLPAMEYGSMVPKWLESWTSHGLSIFRLNGLPFWA